MKKTVTYQDSGVDPDKAGQFIQSFSSFQKTRPKDPNVLSGIGPFASCYSLASALTNIKDPILVTCCDGVGTKLRLALEWDRLSGLGQDLVAMNVNDLICAGATPLNFLDYYACGELNENQWTTILKSIQAGCEEAGCALVGGETAEMPGMYAGKDFDLAGFSTGIADRSKLLGAALVKPGDICLGIESSGAHSNGYSLIRKLITMEKVEPDQTTPFGTETWRDVLLKPTHLYVRPLLPLMPKIHALAHITGGGLLENLPRVLPKGVVAKIGSNTWTFPPLFKWLASKSGLSTEQMLSTFNCGIGMVVVTPPKEVASITQSLKEAHLNCWNIGEIEALPDAGSDPHVRWE